MYLLAYLIIFLYLCGIEFNRYIVMKSRTKSEIANAAAISVRTFTRWLAQHEEKMKEMGVKRTQRLLPPKAVKFICEELGLEEDDFF